MIESTPRTRSRAAQALPAEPTDAGLSSFVSRVPREDPFGGTSEGRGGRYRVIHGSVMMPRPASEWMDKDGHDIPNQPKTETAMPGDVLQLTDDDAKRMLDADVVEPFDAKPSRVGRVWSPPATVPAQYAPPGYQPIDRVHVRGQGARVGR